MIGLKRIVAIGTCVLGVSSGVAFGQAPTAERAINQLTEHVYVYENSMFVVTDEGIILADGSCDNMEFLKSELQTRFNQPVKYVTLSHDHQGHICDTQVFADTAVGVGHVNIREHIIREKRRAIVPQVLFEDQMEIVLGDVRVVLMYLGPTHSDNNIQVHVPAEGVLLAPDVARGRNILPDFRDTEIRNMLKVLRTLAYLPDVSIVLDGHGMIPMTQEEAFLPFHRYLQAVRDRVLERAAAGMSLEQIRQEVTMEDFSDYNLSPARVLTHVETTYDYLWRNREPTVGGPQMPVRAPQD